MRRIRGLAALMLLVPAAGHAVCRVSTSGVVFGVYNPSSSSRTDFAGTVTLTCDVNSNHNGNYNIDLSIGGGTSYAGRRMSAGSANLSYQLYTGPAHIQIWGDGTGASSSVKGADNIPRIGGTTTYNVYGRILAGQTVKPGTYTDLIIATVSY